MVVTDMSAIGASPTYFTYDSFDEVNFSTGGNDVRVATGGIGIGLVTKRGTNAFHGSLNGYFTNDSLQWSNLPAELVGDPRLKGSDKADHTDQLADYSVDIGGPIMKDKLWFYGSYEKNDIRIRNLRQLPDKVDTGCGRNETRPCLRHHSRNIQQVIEMSVRHQNRVRPAVAGGEMTQSIVDAGRVWLNARTKCYAQKIHT